MEGGSVELFKSSSSLLWLTMSNAFVRSIWSSTVLSGGLGLLKPAAMSRLRIFRAEMVECLALNPCWNSGIGRCSCKEGSMSLSRVLLAGHRRETGR